MSRLIIHHYVKSTRVLGPGERSALWVSGCNKHCKGCLANEFAKESREGDTRELCELFCAQTQCEGITISGGEPFLQAEALCEMLEAIRRKRPDYSIVIYTGYTVDELQKSQDEYIARLIELSDIIIDGEYVQEQDNGRAYVGSANQRVIYTSERYRGCGYYETKKPREIELVIGEGGLYMTGVPSAAQLGAWQSIKAQLKGGKES